MTSCTTRVRVPVLCTQCCRAIVRVARDRDRGSTVRTGFYTLGYTQYTFATENYSRKTKLLTGFGVRTFVWTRTGVVSENMQGLGAKLRKLPGKRKYARRLEGK